MSLLFNMLSRLVIAFLPRNKHLLILWLQSLSAMILEPPKIKSVTVSIVSPSICHDVMGPDAMILVFWMLSFKPTFSLSSFTFIKRLFSSSSLSAIRMVSSVYLRLLIFLLEILIPACASSRLAFCMIYSACKLNKQDDSIQYVCLWRPAGITFRKPTGLWEIKTPLLNSTHKISYLLGPRAEAVIWKEPGSGWSDPTCWSWRHSWKGRRKLKLTLGVYCCQPFGGAFLPWGCWCCHVGSVLWIISTGNWPRLLGYQCQYYPQAK